MTKNKEKTVDNCLTQLCSKKQILDWNASCCLTPTYGCLFKYALLNQSLPFYMAHKLPYRLNGPHSLRFINIF